jgi:hypothetical protein
MPIKFTYHVYAPTADTIAATWQVDEPLPHLEVGNKLLLESKNYSQKTGSLLAIEGVRVVISHLDGIFVRYDIHVSCREQESLLRL